MPSRKPPSYTPTYSPHDRGTYRSAGSSERRSVSVLLVVLAAMAALAAFGWLQSRNAAPPGGVQVSVIAGTTAIERASGDSEMPLAMGQEASLQAGDFLRVSADGSAMLKLGRSGSVDLGPGACVWLLELERAMTGGYQARLALDAGSALGRLGNTPPAGTRLIIETTAVTVESMGGVFLCQALATDHAQVAVYEGGAGVSMSEQSTQLQAGEGLDAHLGQPFTPIAVLQPAPTEMAVPQTTVVAPTATLTDREKTLFPRVLTPTRPGDPPAPMEGSTTAGEGTEVWYTVVKGDTLYSIARQYGTSWEAIWEANREALPKPEMLQVGQRLRIPVP